MALDAAVESRLGTRSTIIYSQAPERIGTRFLPFRLTYELPFWWLIREYSFGSQLHGPVHTVPAVSLRVPGIGGGCSEWLWGNLASDVKATQSLQSTSSIRKILALPFVLSVYSRNTVIAFADLFTSSG